MKFYENESWTQKFPTLHTLSRTGQKINTGKDGFNF